MFGECYFIIFISISFLYMYDFISEFIILNVIFFFDVGVGKSTL